MIDFDFSSFNHQLPTRFRLRKHLYKLSLFTTTLLNSFKSFNMVSLPFSHFLHLFIFSTTPTSSHNYTLDRPPPSDCPSDLHLSLASCRELAATSHSASISSHSSLNFSVRITYSDLGHHCHGSSPWPHTYHLISLDPAHLRSKNLRRCPISTFPSLLRPSRLLTTLRSSDHRGLISLSSLILRIPPFSLDLPQFL